jgi:hypothetical protein
VGVLPNDARVCDAYCAWGLADPCTNYFFPANSSVQPAGGPTPDPGVSTLLEKVPGDDSEFIVDHFEKFLTAQIAAKRPFLAHLCTHSIHEPHPSMPEYHAM